jgi:crossover junction endodeoxyribonuclease RusA
MVRLRNGRTVLLESSKRVKPWRALVAYEAGRAHTGAPIECDVTVSAEFIVQRPASHLTKSGQVRDAAPMSPGRPDLDKLCRALLDGLTGVVYRDDSQVIYLNAMKRFGDRSETVVTISYATR